MTEKLVLASGSPFRKAMLVSAGVDLEAVPSEIDERAVEAPLQDSGVSPEDVAVILAEAKALEVSERRPGALVVISRFRGAMRCFTNRRTWKARAVIFWPCRERRIS
jgi:predicted house-cleaning NTP pyrophosphatase (Maf/HAM1 superfamily)